MLGGAMAGVLVLALLLLKGDHYMTTTQPSVPTLKPWAEFDPAHDSRVGAAIRQIAATVADGEWHWWNDLVAEAVSDVNLQPRTVSNRIRQLVSTGQLLKKGEYRWVQQGARKVRVDQRQVKLSPVWKLAQQHMTK